MTVTYLQLGDYAGEKLAQQKSANNMFPTENSTVNSVFVRMRFKLMLAHK